MKKNVLVMLTFILSVLLFSCGDSYEQLPNNFCGKYFDGGLGDEALDNYVNINNDGSWSWENNNGTKNAFGTYLAKHRGEWFNGPDSWIIIFSIEGGELSNYFDAEQVIYYHDINKATGDRNYYRLNGSMPTQGMSTDYYKK